MLRSLLLLTAASKLALPSPAGAQKPAAGPACPLHLQITDEDGKALPKAFVFIHNERGTNQQVTPDTTAQLKINLRSGMYDLFVSAPGFVPRAQIVDLRTCKPVDLKITLSIDSEHAENDGN